MLWHIGRGYLPLLYEVGRRLALLSGVIVSPLSRAFASRKNNIMAVETDHMVVHPYDIIVVGIHYKQENYRCTTLGDLF
jgi:hypothetical protein